ncbi:MAG TPA: zf-HC2 domain-containing protein [Vicinamibacterales bacterium]|nr:zf-HC2 domain-containing protein [Vicinamibacterales bacterium]
MCDKERLVAYVYDEIAEADRVRLDAHLRDCAACRAEIAELRQARTDLSAWTPPALDLGFQVTRPSHGRARPWRSPVWGLAAAAVLVLAVAAAIANVQVRYDATGLTVRTGWRVPAASASSVPATPVHAAIDPAESARLAQIDRRLRQLEDAADRPQAARVAAVSAPVSEADVMRRVKDILSHSESRQQQELALRIAQVVRDVDAQRQADLVRIQQGMGRLEGIATADQVQHRQVMDFVARVAERQK